MDRTVLIEVLPHVEEIEIYHKCLRVAAFCFSFSKCEYLSIPKYVKCIPVKLCEESYIKSIDIEGDSTIDQNAFYHAYNLSRLSYAGIEVQNEYEMYQENSFQIFVCRNYDSQTLLNRAVKIDYKITCFCPKCQTYIDEEFDPIMQYSILYCSIWMVTIYDD